jgi:maleate isomerase
LTLVETLRVDPVLTDTHRIYELTSDDAYEALVSLTRHDVDAIVVSGTGMPTLQALRRWRSERGDSPPVLSSNLCLAWALLQHAAPELAPQNPTLLIKD